MSANERQVGGDHYRSRIQHWDFVEDHGIGYLEGCATKYVARHASKNGLEDLQKAGHYVQKLSELAQGKGSAQRAREPWKRAPRGHASIQEIQVFCEENRLKPLESHFCMLLFSHWTLDDLADAARIVEQIIERDYSPREDNTGMREPRGYDGQG